MRSSPRPARRQPTHRRPTYHHGNLRRDLLDAALRRFEERGGADFTLRELARELGVTHNAPYRHFASKQELVDALREEGFSRLAALERRALEAAGPGARARVKALGEVYVRLALAEPAAFQLMMGPEGSAGGEPRATESYQLLEGALEQARAVGEARRDLSARELALAAWSLVHGLSALVSSGRIPGGEARVRRYAEILATVFFDGAAPR